LLAGGDEGIDELYWFDVFDRGGCLFAGSPGGDERIFDDFRLRSDDLTLRKFSGGREAGRPGEGAGTVVASGDLVAVIDGRIDGVIGRGRDVVQLIVEAQAVAGHSPAAVAPSAVGPEGADGGGGGKRQGDDREETQFANHGASSLQKGRRSGFSRQVPP